MNIYKVKILKKEFPFLDKLFEDCGNPEWSHIKPEEVNNIQVKKGDKVLLKKVGYEDCYARTYYGDLYNYVIYFACEQNIIIKLQGAGKAACADQFGTDMEWNAPSIGEQLILKKIDPEYIIECIQNDIDNDGDGQLTRFWTIFKMKNFNLVNYHMDEIDKAAAALKKEMKAVCCK